MKEFAKRLGRAFINIGMLTMLTLVIIVVALIVVWVVILLPISGLELIVGDKAGYWIFIVFGMVAVLYIWEDLKQWIQWQFIKPFKNKGDEK